MKLFLLLTIFCLNALASTPFHREELIEDTWDIETLEDVQNLIQKINNYLPELKEYSQADLRALVEYRVDEFHQTKLSPYAVFEFNQDRLTENNMAQIQAAKAENISYTKEGLYRLAIEELYETDVISNEIAVLEEAKSSLESIVRRSEMLNRKGMQSSTFDRRNARHSTHAILKDQFESYSDNANIYLEDFYLIILSSRFEIPSEMKGDTELSNRQMYQLVGGRTYGIPAIAQLMLGMGDMPLHHSYDRINRLELPGGMIYRVNHNRSFISLPLEIPNTPEIRRCFNGMEDGHGNYAEDDSDGLWLREKVFRQTLWNNLAMGHDSSIVAPVTSEAFYSVANQLIAGEINSIPVSCSRTARASSTGTSFNPENNMVHIKMKHRADRGFRPAESGLGFDYPVWVVDRSIHINPNFQIRRR